MSDYIDRMPSWRLRSALREEIERTRKARREADDLFVRLARITRPTRDDLLAIRDRVENNGVALTLPQLVAVLEALEEK